MFGRGFDSHRLHYFFAFLGETLLNQRFFIFIFGFPLSSFAKKDTTKESQTDPKTDPIFKKAIKKDTTFVAS